MRVHVLHVGDSKVPFGQFYGGFETAWQGSHAVITFFRSQNQHIMVPIYAFLVEHPVHGAMLVDTGINWRQAHDHQAYYHGPLLRATFPDDEYRLEPHQQLTQQLARRGLRPDDVRIVVLTHLHEDHLGGVRDLLGARFLVTATEWQARNLGIFLFRRTPSLKGILRDPELVRFTAGPFGSFGASYDVFGDGSVVLLPTPGHSRGHLSVYVNGGTWQLLLVGDTLYTIRHLASDQVRPLMLGRTASGRQLASIASIRSLRTMMPALVIAPGHDHTEYGTALERTFQGTPDPAGLKRLNQVYASLFDDNMRLQEPSHPVFQAGTGSLGSVQFAPSR